MDDRKTPVGFNIKMTTKDARAVVAVLKAYRGYKIREEICQDVARIIDRQIDDGVGEKCR